MPPGALVMTEGEDGGRIETAEGVSRFDAHALEGPILSEYGAGDTFAAALTWHLAAGQPIEAAASSAARHAAAVLSGLNPIESQQPLTAGD
jgi:ribokinase